ncbi:MAG: M1 family metallopeptidase [Bacteroidia bacterium]
MRSIYLLILLVFTSLPTKAYWQQKVDYVMKITMDTENHQFTGSQNLTYYNNSPDTLYRVFYHLYLNAFQPGSMMDVRSRSIADPDPRIGKRIAVLDDDKIGFQKIKLLKHRGEAVNYFVDGTVVEVKLNQPILPGESSVFEMDFIAQVPLQIRRTGRQNKEGIDYSMAQWYPKIAEYDEMGWHPDPYIFREFYGVWGDFDVTITIDSSYVIGGTGILQNPTEIGHGYCAADKVNRNGDDRLTWHFIAKNVHDFVWAADPDYKHTTYLVENGPLLHFFYQTKDSTTIAWKEFPPLAAKGFKYLSEHFGKYPFEQYSIIQGGDGGMEYPMATLITGDRKIGSLFGVTMHEAAHSWYQMLLGSNESKYPWMDEGFTNYAGNEAFNKVMWPNGKADPHKGSFISYRNIVKRGLEEPMSTHADHFNTNYAYGVSSYSKGELFLVQLKYIVGEPCFNRSMKRYFKDWAFKHPSPFSFIRILEKESGMILDWYLEYWVYTTKTIDYEVVSVDKSGSSTIINLKRNGLMIMPCEVLVGLKNGDEQLHYIPLGLQRGAKKANLIKHDSWKWVDPEYNLKLNLPIKDIKWVRLNFERNVADINPDNDELISKGLLNKFKPKAQKD